MARGRGRSGALSGRGTSASGRVSPNPDKTMRANRARGGRGNPGHGTPEAGGKRRDEREGGSARAAPPPQRPGSRMGTRGSQGGGRGPPGEGVGGDSGGHGRQPSTVALSPYVRGSGGCSGGSLKRSQPGHTHGTPSSRKPQRGKDIPLELHGLANQYLFVELEKDGVWKVSVPEGQRFGKSFLAGLEVWARQVLRGEQPVLCKVLRSQHAPSSAAAAADSNSSCYGNSASKATTPATPLPAPSSSYTAQCAPALRSFIPPPPPQPITSGAGNATSSCSSLTSKSGSALTHPVSTLTGSGLPGLETLELEDGRDDAGPSKLPSRRRSGLAPSPAPTVLAEKAPKGSCPGLQAETDTAFDFVSLLQAQAGLGRSQEQQKSVWGVKVGAESKADAVSAIPKTRTTLLEDKFTSITRQQPRPHPNNQEEKSEQPQELEYRGLLASSEDEDDEEQEVQEEVEVAEGEEPAEVVEGVVPGSEYCYFEEGEEEEGNGEGSYKDVEDEECFSDDDGDYEDEEWKEEVCSEEAKTSTAEEDEYDSHEDNIVQRLSKARPGSPTRPMQPPVLSSPLPVASSPPLSPPPPPPSSLPSGLVMSSPPLSLEIVHKCASLDSSGRLRISLRLERQLLNDTEMEMLAAWYQERASCLVELSKLWLFDNRIGDRGAAAVADALLHPRLLELHLSHNVIGDKGAAALLGALPVERPVGLRPLWLRMEWNIINVEMLQQQLDEQRRTRGLISDVPEVRPSSGVAAKLTPIHENTLVLGRPSGCSSAVVRLPWVACQKQPPSEAEVLRAVRGFYTRGRTHAAASSPAPTVPPPKPQSQPDNSATPLQPPPPPPPPPPPQTSIPVPLPRLQPLSPAVAKTPTLARSTSVPAIAAAISGEGSYAPGPLLLFPDTSALVFMLGANTSLMEPAAVMVPGSSASVPAVAAAKASQARSGGGGGGGSPVRPPLQWSLLTSLAAQGRFGRSLPLHDQVFVVVTDSVMKQLDGLKSLPETRAAVRRFMSEGLEQAGPAGYDFLTVLGAHEGEGLALAGEHGGLMGLAGSRSPWLASRGQAVDVRIVEVALYYLAEVTRAFQQGKGGSDANGAPSSGGASPRSKFLPVILLSNDNAQISAAKSHGLPAFRLSSATELGPQLDALAAGSGALTSGVLRQLLAPQATKGLGTAATRSLQDQFDCAVGTLRGVVAVLKGLLPPLERISQLAAAPPPPGSKDSSEEGPLSEIRSILEGCGSSSPSAPTDEAAWGEGGQEESAGTSGLGLVWGLEKLLVGLQAEIVNWEGVIRTHQAPSRLVQWAALGSAGEKDG